MVWNPTKYQENSYGTVEQKNQEYSPCDVQQNKHIIQHEMPEKTAR